MSDSVFSETADAGFNLALASDVVAATHSKIRVDDLEEYGHTIGEFLEIAAARHGRLVVEVTPGYLAFHRMLDIRPRYWRFPNDGQIL